VLAVPGKKCSRLYHDIQSYADVSAHLIATITHFFEHYKDLDPGKWVKVEGWHGPDEARQEILASIERYKVGK
jgi:inorganic pyrophosphatase